MPLDLTIVFIHGNSLERLAASNSYYLPLLGRPFVVVVVLSLPLVVCIDSRPFWVLPCAWAFAALILAASLRFMFHTLTLTQVADNPLGSGNLGSSIS